VFSELRRKEFMGVDFIQLLKDMQSEVSDFHPFLNDLFKELPGVTHVHYTHGPNEMGADFVIYRNDSALDQRDVIGVVAKLGGIKIDHSDVERQIDECMVSRLSSDGREEIQINEVWVAASGGITENARRKIAEKYRGRKVSFLKNERLAALAEKHLPDYGLGMPIAYGDYKDGLLGVMRDLDNRSSLIPGLEILYQYPDVDELRPDNHGLFKVSRGFASIEALYEGLVDRSFTLIESGMGGGKSRLLRELIRHGLARAEFSQGKRIPIFISSSDLQNIYDYNLDALIKDRTLSFSADLAPALFVVIDGFDELNEEMERKTEIIQSLVKWANQLGRNVVLTTRPNDKLQASWANVKQVSFLRIKPLRGKKALALFTAVGGNADLSKRIQKDLSSSPLLKSLDASPISYTLLARIMKENNQEIPASVPELFNKYFELVLGRWEIDKGLRKQVEYSVMHACLGEFSVSLMDNNRGEMSLEEAKRIVSDYVKPRRIDLDPETFIRLLSERSHVLYVDSITGTVGFRHRGFCEFFYAYKLHRSNSIDISEDVFHPYWVGTYYFLAGLLKDCPELVASLRSIDLKSEMHIIIRLINLGHILQAGFMTPYDEVGAAVKRACMDAADLYIFARNDPASTLNGLTVMQLLGVLRSIMVDVYGYDSFEKPLADAICDLASDAQSERNALALLFATLAHNDADGRVNFDELLGSYGDALPVEIKLVIRSETSKLADISDTLKKFNRNLVKSIRAHAKGKYIVEIERLFESPIKSLSLVKK
jgi:hypothetical protein